METILILLKIVFSIASGLIAGLLTIHTFNRIPAKWLCDYDQKPEPGMWGVRIKKRPWTIVFVLVFIAASLKLMNQGFLYAIPGLIALWLLLQIGIADMKYLIIPDQFVIALAVTALGFIPFHSDYRSLLLGALVGGGSVLLIGVIGSLILKKEAMGFGDVKLLAAVGLMSGLKGIVIILILTIFSSAIVFAAGLITGKIKYGDVQPLGPFIAASAALYVLFKPELLVLANLYSGL